MVWLIFGNILSQNMGQTKSTNSWLVCYRSIEKNELYD